MLTIKLRKSPFDLSTSHHAHQEIVKGVTTEFAGPNLGKVEIAHWYEYVLLLGVSGSSLRATRSSRLWRSSLYFLEILIDNTFARVKWQLDAPGAWIIAGTLGLSTSGYSITWMGVIHDLLSKVTLDHPLRRLSCNGCDIEVLACLTPCIDVERFGIINTGNPKHADILLSPGASTKQNREVVQKIYDQMPEPKVVVALGICANIRRDLPRVLQRHRRDRQGDPGGCLHARVRGTA